MRARAVGQLMQDEKENVPDLTGIVRAHAARVRRVLSRRGVPAADLPDAEQEVFVVAHRKLAELEVRSSLGAWLLAIAANVASQHRRRARRRRESAGLAAEPACEAPDALARLQAHEQVARVRRLLDALAPDQREVIVLHELSELPMREVARALRLPLKTAFSRLYAGHRSLKRAAAREALCTPPRTRTRGRIGALLTLWLGSRWLPRAQAALLPASVAALMSLGLPDAPSFALTSASTEVGAGERLMRPRALPTVLAPARAEEPAPLKGSQARRGPAPAPLAPAPPEIPAAAELIVLHVDGAYGEPSLPYPHPFAERSFTSVDPRTVKPRVVTFDRAPCDPVRDPCAL